MKKTKLGDCVNDWMDYILILNSTAMKKKGKKKKPDANERKL